MESTDQYNFSIFSPRNLHGRKNRNVIISMLLIWTVAVFGFQILLRVIEKPTPEKSLIVFESQWPAAQAGDAQDVDYKALLNSLVLVKGKSTVKPGDRKILSGAISCGAFKVLPDSIKPQIMRGIADLQTYKSQLVTAKDEEYLRLKTMVAETGKMLAVSTGEFSGFDYSSLEAAIFVGSLEENHPDSFSDEAFIELPGIMKLYLTHNQSSLTDSKFLGFPFHYFYTAVFLLILFIVLCIVYNILIEWRLGKEGIVE
jgi:uncharacterized membrane protein